MQSNHRRRSSWHNHAAPTGTKILRGQSSRRSVSTLPSTRGFCLAVAPLLLARTERVPIPNSQPHHFIFNRQPRFEPHPQPPNLATTPRPENEVRTAGPVPDHVGELCRPRTAALPARMHGLLRSHDLCSTNPPSTKNLSSTFVTSS